MAKSKAIDWRKSAVLVTGGTGSFGKKFVKLMLKEYRPKKIVIFSRDELKQHEMKVGGYDHASLRYFIGDVRDIDRLRRAMHGIDVVVHAAALKQVPTCEYNPIEAVLTNVMGTRNIIEASLDGGVKRVLTLSTDKAVGPVNLYGATKLVAEKLTVQANAYRGDGPTRFSCVRYGNVVGSRGSVIPLFMEQRKTGRVTLTDSRMTRFWITLDQGARFVIRCIEQMHGGEVFIPKIPSMSMTEMAKVLAPDCKVEQIGIRPGEKLHEALISEDESISTVEVKDMFILQPAHSWWSVANWPTAKRLPAGFKYASDTNRDWLSPKGLKQMVKDSASRGEVEIQV